MTWIIAAIVLAVATGVAIAALRRDVVVFEWEHALLYRDGRFAKLLAPGRHRLWRMGARHDVYRLPNHVQMTLSAPVDVFSADHFAFRLAASALYRINDPRAAQENPYLQPLQLALADALRTAAQKRTLQALLLEREAIAAELREEVAAKLACCEFQMVSITSIAMPPEVRRMITEAERARLESEAALERARGEQGALRALANAARNLKGNPELLSLRMLQAVGQAGKGATLVLGDSALADRTWAGAARADAKAGRKSAPRG